MFYYVMLCCGMLSHMCFVVIMCCADYTGWFDEQFQLPVDDDCGSVCVCVCVEDGWFKQPHRWPESDWTLRLGEAAHLLHIEQSVRTG